MVAGYRIRAGRSIGSAALVADGLHARTDGFTSLAVLHGVGGVAVGWNRADPVVGLIITIAILAVLRQVAREIYRRLMDAVDPDLQDAAVRTLRDVAGVIDAGDVRLRWRRTGDQGDRALCGESEVWDCRRGEGTEGRVRVADYEESRARPLGEGGRRGHRGRSHGELLGDAGPCPARIEPGETAAPRSAHRGGSAEDRDSVQ